MKATILDAYGITKKDNLYLPADRKVCSICPPIVKTSSNKEYCMKQLPCHSKYWQEKS